jgi:hypothetical protein
MGYAGFVRGLPAGRPGFRRGMVGRMLRRLGVMLRGDRADAENKGYHQ